jgi:hypothetical protein
MATKKTAKPRAVKKAPAKKTPAKKTPAKKAPVKMAATAALAEYRRKRDFTRTREPAGGKAAAGTRLAYVIQMHAASHLHLVLRLELVGVLKCWAVP